MLFQIGPVRVTVAPFNAHETARNTETNYVEKPVLGTTPPVEFVGEGGEKITIRGRLFPRRLGGMSDMIRLHAARKTGQPQYIMRGDGQQFFWGVIESISERSSFLDSGGVGQMIEFDMSIRKCSAPSAGSYFSLMRALFQ